MSLDPNVAATLSAWQAQVDDLHQRRRANGGGQAGVVHPQQMVGKTGLEVMTGMLLGQLPHPHMAETLACDMVELGDGLVVFQATPRLAHLNPMGSVHGGWFATLLDFALGCAVHTKLPAGVAYTTSQINLNIVRAAHIKTGPLRCIGTAIHVGRQVGTSEARVVGPDGKLYAHASTTCAIFPARPAA